MPMPVSATAISTWESTRSQRDLHAAAARRELDRVGQEVPRPPAAGGRVAGDGPAAGSRIGLERGCPWRRPRAHRLDRGVDERVGIERLHVEAQLAGHDPAHVEQVLDELGLRRARCARSTRGPRAVRLGAAAVTRSSCAQPRMAFSGVRSSCDSVARNSSLIRSCARPRRAPRARSRAAPCAPRRPAAPLRRAGRCRSRSRPARRRPRPAARRAR